MAATSRASGIMPSVAAARLPESSFSPVAAAAPAEASRGDQADDEGRRGKRGEATQQHHEARLRGRKHEFEAPVLVVAVQQMETRLSSLLKQTDGRFIYPGRWQLVARSGQEGDPLVFGYCRGWRWCCC